MILTEDLQTAIVDTRDAATLAGVSPGLVRKWASLGRLRRANRHGPPRYRAMDVLRLEAATRRRPRRPRG